MPKTKTTPAEREAEARAKLLDAFESICPGIVGNPFVPHWPTPPQQLFLGLHLRSGTGPGVFEAMYGGSAGGGKLLDLETPIATPSGFVPLRWLAPGDCVIGRDGSPCVILAESDVQHVPAWRFVFDDGSEIVSNDDHRWLTFDAAELGALTRKSDEWRAARRSRRPSVAKGNKSAAFVASIVGRNKAKAGTGSPPPTGTVRTTAEIVATLRTPSGRTNHAIPVAQPLDLPHRQLPLNPYLLGVWLGDGTTAAGSVTTMDPEILAAFDAAGFERGAVQVKAKGDAATHSILGLRTVLRQVGVLGNKHVPHAYLWASIDQRLALLQGLMDTDGSVCPDDGGVEFTNTNRSLADAVALLFRSLGHKASVREGVATLDGRAIGPKWRVSLMARVPVFRLRRKLDRQRMPERRTTQFRYIVDAQRVPTRPMKCLRVSSSDSLFLAGEHLIPTHNSDCLLMAGAQFLHIPSFAGLVVRRTYSDLAKPGAIMDRALTWWRNLAHWDGSQHCLTFPSGAKIQFSYMQNPNDHLNHKSAEYQTTLWDELTELPLESQYSFVGHSRVRRNVGSTVPLRTLSATNPGGPGHAWVKKRFVGDPLAGVKPTLPGRYIPARVRDNPHIDQDSYIAGLMHLHPTVREQMLNGDWRARDPGDYFRAEWFGGLLDPATDTWPAGDCVRIRWWDLAASEKPEAARTAGVKMARHRSGVRAVEHCRAFRATPGKRDDLIIQTAKADGFGVTVGLEIEGGSGGPAQFEALSKRLRQMGYRVVGARPRVGAPDLNDREKATMIRQPTQAKGKEGRADPVASCLERGYQRRGECPDTGGPWWGVDANRDVVGERDGIRLFAGPWTQDYLDELEGFPPDNDGLCDLVDATSGAWAWLEAHPAGYSSAMQTEQKSPSIEIANVHPDDRPAVDDSGRDRSGRWTP